MLYFTKNAFVWQKWRGNITLYLVCFCILSLNIGLYKIIILEVCYKCILNFFEIACETMVFRLTEGQKIMSYRGAVGIIQKWESTYQVQYWKDLLILAQRFWSISPAEWNYLFLSKLGVKKVNVLYWILIPLFEHLDLLYLPRKCAFILYTRCIFV